MSEKLKRLPEIPEIKNNSGIISPKVRRFLEAFSLSVGLILGGNVYAGDTDNYSNNPLKPHVKGGEQDKVFNELKYNFIEKNIGLIGAILEKLKNDGNFEKGFIDVLEYIQDNLVIFFSDSIKKNGLVLEYDLNEEIIGLLAPVKQYIQILTNIRYWKGYCDIFDGKDHSKSSLKIIFKETDKGYIIESLYIIRGDYSEEKDKNSISSFLNQV